MKRSWIYNLLGTLLLLAVYLLVNNFYYGSLIEFYTSVAIVGILSVQFIVGSLRAIIRMKEYSYLDLLLALVSITFSLLVLLFAFNGSLWDTDTGAFRSWFLMP